MHEIPDLGQIVFAEDAAEGVLTFLSGIHSPTKANRFTANYTAKLNQQLAGVVAIAIIS